MVEAIGWDMRDLFVSDDGFRSYEARNIGSEQHDVDLDDTPLPTEVPVAVREMVLAIHRADGDDGEALAPLVGSAQVGES